MNVSGIVIDKNDIRRWRKLYKLSLAQFGNLINAPAISVKRWEDGVKPSEKYSLQMALVFGLWENARSTFYMLQRGGYKVNRQKWDLYCKLLRACQDMVDKSKAIDFDPLLVNESAATILSELPEQQLKEFTIDIKKISEDALPKGNECIMVATIGLLSVISEAFFMAENWQRIKILMGLEIGRFL